MVDYHERMLGKKIPIVSVKIIMEHLLNIQQILEVDPYLNYDPYYLCEHQIDIQYYVTADSFEKS